MTLWRERELIVRMPRWFGLAVNEEFVLIRLSVSSYTMQNGIARTLEYEILFSLFDMMKAVS